MVVRRGNAPRSSAYRADALLLSYGTGKGQFSIKWYKMVLTFDPFPLTPALSLGERENRSQSHNTTDKFMTRTVPGWRRKG